MKPLKKEYKDNTMIYLVALENTNQALMENQAIMIYKKPFFGDIDNSYIQEINQVEIIHENRPFYKFSYQDNT